MDPRGAGKRGPVEEIVALQAVHGDAIDDAVDHLWSVATGGARLRFGSGAARRSERVEVVGYAGHNRLMDGKRLPTRSGRSGDAIASFVLACESEPYFGGALQAAGSTPLLTTRTLMAPEGYLIDAVARALGSNPSMQDLRREAVSTYAQWQGLSARQAGAIFAKR